MGGLVSSLGLGEGGGSTGAAGADFAAEGVPIDKAVNVGEAQGSTREALAALERQKAFTSALAAQNGIGNQSAVFNQLGDIVSGTGPNPAMAALNQATAANTANQAALMAGQRGAGANAGLIARQAAMQGGANQQAAVGQGALMQAQQSLNALNMQGGIAGQQVGQEANANQALMSGTQNEQQNLLNAIAGQNNAAVGMRSNQNSANAGVANTVAGGQQKFGQDVFKGVTSGAGKFLGLAHGGEVPAYAEGGPINFMPMSVPSITTPTITTQGPVLSKAAQYIQNQQNNALPNTSAQPMPNNTDQSGDQSGVTQAISGGINKLFGGDSSAAMAGGPMDAGNTAPVGMMAAHGGKVPAMVSPGEMYLPPEKAQAVAQKNASPMEGERIPGKAKIKGDSLKNDTVAKTLEEGGVVIPRSIMESKDAAKKAAAFVTAHLAKNGHLPKRPK